LDSEKKDTIVFAKKKKKGALPTVPQRKSRVSGERGEGLERKKGRRGKIVFPSWKSPARGRRKNNSRKEGKRGKKGVGLHFKGKPSTPAKKRPGCAP